MAELDEPTKPGRGETEVKAEDDSVRATEKYISEGTPLVLFQVNCRRICNKIIEFWNLIVTYNPDVVISTESWVREEINNAEDFRDDYITFRRDRYFRGGGVFICVKNYIDCRELWADEDFEMVAVKIKGRNPKFTWKVVGVYRAPNEDMRVVERLASRTGSTGNCTKRSIIGGGPKLTERRLEGKRRWK
jgi:hypothetical protein